MYKKSIISFRIIFFLIFTLIMITFGFTQEFKFILLEDYNFDVYENIHVAKGNNIYVLGNEKDGDNIFIINTKNYSIDCYL